MALRVVFILIIHVCFPFFVVVVSCRDSSWWSSYGGCTDSYDTLPFDDYGIWVKNHFCCFPVILLSGNLRLIINTTLYSITV